MNKIDFFTPVRYEGTKTFKQHLMEGIEDYFYLGGKSAYVIPGKIVGNCQEVILNNKDQNKITQIVLGAIKIISYMTVVLPMIMFTAKAIFRSTYTFHVGPLAKQENVPNTQETTAKVTQSVLGLSPALAQTNNKSSVASLVDRFTKAWNSDKKSFDLSPNSFDLESFSKDLSSHAEQFKKKGVTNDQHFGYIEKFDLNPSDNPQIYMRADLHGDLKSLLENIRSLQAQGLLNQNFNCKPGVHLVFLGDYCDRGKYGTQILELLMRLREENPDQVHLIRGNHESNFINMTFGGSDPHLMQVIDNKEARDALERFYETMSLTTYFSLDQGESREYVQCTHGLFELTMDPAPLLDKANSGDYLPVPKARNLSGRIRKIADGDSKLSEAAKRIDTLVKQSNLEPDITAYNWADVSLGETKTGLLGNRQYALSARDIQHYLELSSEQHRVMMIFRGHQHAFQHLMHEDRVLVTTLPVGMDCPGYQNRFEQPDRAYIIKPSTLVENWTKRAIKREKGRMITDEITEEFQLTSSAV